MSSHVGQPSSRTSSCAGKSFGTLQYRLQKQLKVKNGTKTNQGTYWSDSIEAAESNCYHVAGTSNAKGSKFG
jgi:hypothetical protein